jgi:tRNA pseudouridine38-40 synthase
MKLKLTLQYNGTHLGGWQFQPEQGAPVLPSVQGALANAMSQLLGGVDVNPTHFMGAGRTDAGVHALGQVCHFARTKQMPLIKYLDGLNHFLPPEIRVVRVAWVDETFNARKTATARHYVYLLENTRVLRPHYMGQRGHMVHPLNLVAMQQALSSLPLEETDFSSFRDAECQSHTPICRLLYRDMQVEGPSLTFRFAADHFLHHMVRNIMGTLVEVGLGKRAADSIPTLLAQKDRRKAGLTFMPDGLYLTQVDYKPHKETEFVGQ